MSAYFYCCLTRFRKIFFSSYFVGLSIFLSACSSNYAPVENAWYQSLPAAGIYVVQPGETVYAISILYGIDVNQLIKYNHLTEPYTIYKGQHLYINRPAPILPKPIVKLSSSVKSAVTFQRIDAPVSPPKPVGTSSKKNAGTPTFAKPVAATPSKTAITPKPVATKKTAGIHWQWPARGKILQSFASNKKGMDIAGNYGDAIYTAAAGQVVYSGSGLANYGKLIIIKNSENYLSAYAYNSELMVKEGEQVKAGQQIAKMGNDNDNRPALHFEIRHKGKPVNPLKYLPKQ